MAPVYSEDFEGGSDGAEVTSSNSTVSGDIRNPTFSDLQHHSGSLSVLFDTTSTTQYLIWTWAATDPGWYGFYIWPTAYPGSTTSIMSAQASGSKVSDLRFNTSGTLAIRDNNTTRGTSSVSLTLNSWNRVEFRFDDSGGTLGMRVYVGANADGDTPDYELSSGTFSGAAPDELRLGVITSGTLTWYLDDTTVADTDWPGPIVDSTNWTVDVTDTVALTDSTTRAQGHARTVTDPVTVTDAATRNQSADRIVTDPAGITDAVTLARGYGRTATDPVGITDTVSLLQTHEIVVTDDLGVTDEAGVSGAGTLATTNDLGITDQVLLAVSYARTVVDPVQFIDAQVLTRDLSVTDPVAVTDEATQQKGGENYTVTVTDDLGITDGSPAPGWEGTLTEPMGITDSVTLTKTTGTIAVLVITDDMGITEPANGRVEYVHDVLDNLGITDTTVTPKSVNPVDDLGITDLVTLEFIPSSGHGRTFPDSMGISDLVILDHVVAHSWTLTVTDGMGLADNVATTLIVAPNNAVLSRTDTITVTDHVTVLHTVAGAARLRLVLNRALPGPRVDDWFWRHAVFLPQPTQVALLVYPDGTVIETTDLESATARSAPFIAGGGHETILDHDAWQVQVLQDAGYELEPVP